MKLTSALTLMIGIILWQRNWVETHHQGSFQEDSSDYIYFHLLQDLYNESHAEKNTLITSNAAAPMWDIHLGAAGKTREELEKFLYVYPEPGLIKRVSTSTNALKRTKNKTDNLRREFCGIPLIFVRKDFTLRKEYIQNITIPQLVTVVDFSGKAATEEINKMVSNFTEGRIQQIYKAAVDPYTQFVLLECCRSPFYIFEQPFPTSKTKRGKFFTGKKYVDVDMMNNKQLGRYWDNSSLKYEAITIADTYAFFVMNIILPYEDQTLENMTSLMNADDFAVIWTPTDETIIDYKIPKMKFSTANSLKSALQKEGLNTIFGKPDFKPMTTSRKLRVADFESVNEIQIDETTINVSAATAVRFSKYSSKQIPKRNKILSNIYQDTVTQSPKYLSSSYRKTKDIPGIKNQKKFYVDRPFLLTIIFQFLGIQFQSFVHQPNGDSIEIDL